MWLALRNLVQDTITLPDKDPLDIRHAISYLFNTKKIQLRMFKLKYYFIFSYQERAMIVFENNK